MEKRGQYVLNRGGKNVSIAPKPCSPVHSKPLGERVVGLKRGDPAPRPYDALHSPQYAGRQDAHAPGGEVQSIPLYFRVNLRMHASLQ